MYYFRVENKTWRNFWWGSNNIDRANLCFKVLPGGISFWSKKVMLVYPSGFFYLIVVLMRVFNGLYYSVIGMDRVV